LENGVLPAFIPWIFLSLTLQNNVLLNGVTISNEGYSNAYFHIFNFLTGLSILNYLLFEFFKRRANRVIYKRENESIFRIAEYFIVFSANMFFISVPTFVLAAFGSLLSNREYIVAEKKLKK
jgi:hypothetical protein